MNMLSKKTPQPRGKGAQELHRLVKKDMANLTIFIALAILAIGAFLLVVIAAAR